MTTLHEVLVEAAEPWHNGLRNAYRNAVLTFCECNNPGVNEVYNEQGFGFDDADAQLTAYCGPDYEGYGQNAHPDADQFVFTNADVAQRFADALRDEVKPAGAIVSVFTLETE